MRLAIDRDCLKMFAHRPMSGWGLGVFPDIYPEFRSFYSDFAVDRAHNDYLQLLVETGATGMAMMLWFLAVVYRSALRKLKARTDTNNAVALATCLGVTGILAHSFFDFNLQIPANASMFLVLCGIAAMGPRFGLRKKRHGSTLPAPEVTDRFAHLDKAPMD